MRAPTARSILPLSTIAVHVRHRPLRVGKSVAGSRGFTLLEVLIALLVLALALVALARTAALQVENFTELRERTLADWLAQQVLAETRLANPLPNPARSSGQRRYGGRDWHWELEIQATQVPTIRRLDVRVAAATTPAQPVASLTGFTGTDLVR